LGPLTVKNGCTTRYNRNPSAKRVRIVSRVQLKSEVSESSLSLSDIEGAFSRNRLIAGFRTSSTLINRGHMPGKLFIGNLSFNTTDEEMTELFSGMSIPTTGIRIVRDPNTGRSRGFAFAELPPEANLESAITQLNGKILDGRPLTVNEARRQKPGQGPRGHGRAQAADERWQ